MLVCAILLSFFATQDSGSQSLEQDVRTRIEMFIVNGDTFPQRIACEYEFTIVGKPSDSLVERYRRDVVVFALDREKNLLRCDAQVLRENSLMQEHCFSSGSNAKRLYATGTGTGLNVKERRDEHTSQLVRIPRYRLATLLNNTGLYSTQEKERELLHAYLNARVIHAEHIDGKLTATLLFKNAKAGVRIQFAEDPNWIPISTHFFWRQANPPIDFEKATLPDLEKWKVHSITEGTWKKFIDEGEEFYAPTMLTTSIRSPTGHESYSQWRFAKWRFGDDVDSSYVDETNFTSEKIRAFPFSSIVERMEKEGDFIRN